MARTNKKGEIFSHLTSFGVFRDNPGLSTTLSAAEAAGQTVLSLTGVVNAADLDWHRVGADEDVEIIQQTGAAAGSDITSKWALGRSHAALEAVVEQVKTDLGHITDDGVKFNISASTEEVNSAIRRLQLSQLVGHMQMQFEVMLEGFNLENLATALGMLESRVLGSHTFAAPGNLFVDGAQAAEQNNLCFYADGVRKDGLITQVHFLGVELDLGALQTQFSRGTMSPITIRGRCTSGVRMLIGAAS